MLGRARTSSQALTPDVREAIDTIRSIYVIDTMTADTETGLVSGFAWLIYFSVVKTEQLETETEVRDLRLKTETEARD